jgi:hypothetical protein
MKLWNAISRIKIKKVAVSLELGPDPVNQGKSHYELPDQRIRIDRRTPVSMGPSLRIQPISVAINALRRT